jgi:hypothetical protein
MRGALLWIVLAGSCGRIGFDPGDGDARPGDADAAPVGLPHVVQHASRFVGNGTSIAVPLAGAVGAGDILVVATSTSQQNGMPTVSDSRGNTYVLAVTDETVGDAVAAIYVAAATAAGPDTITCGISVIDNIHCHVYDVANATTVVEATGKIVEPGPALTVMTTGPATAGSYMLAYFSGNNTMATFVPDTSYADTEYTVSATIDAAFSEDRLVATPGVQIAAATASNSITFVNVIVALHAAH